MNKLLFKLEVNFGEDISFICNNHLDLEEYLNKEYDWYRIDVKENSVVIKMRDGFENDIASLEWVKHI